MTHLVWIPLGSGPERLNACFTSADDGTVTEERGVEWLELEG